MMGLIGTGCILALVFILGIRLGAYLIEKDQLSIFIIDVMGGKIINPKGYPESKPTKAGKYLCHDKLHNKWFVNTWRGRNSFSWRELVDVYFPYELKYE